MEGTTKPRGGDTDIYTVYCHGTPLRLSAQKYDVAFQNCQTKVYRWIFRQSVYGTYIERKSAIEGTTKPREGYRYMQFTGENTMSILIWLSFSRRTCFFLVVELRTTEQHLHTWWPRMYTVETEGIHYDKSRSLFLTKAQRAKGATTLFLKCCTPRPTVQPHKKQQSVGKSTPTIQ